jgi:hypothetical protein
MSTHETLDGPLHVMGITRDGWAFRCECGYRSRLFTTEAATRQAMTTHVALPATPTPKRRWLSPSRFQWPGSPVDRRRR